MSDFNKLMHNWRSFKEAETHMTKAVKKGVKKAVKQQQVIIEKNLAKTQQAMEEIANDMPISLQEHFSANKENIFVPVLDEATGEEQWESRNFDELLNEMDNPDSDIDEDRLRTSEIVTRKISKNLGLTSCLRNMETKRDSAG